MVSGIKIEVPYRFGDSFRLVTLGDIHRGAEGCDEDAACEAAEDATKPKTLAIGMGDYAEWICPIDKRYSRASVASSYGGYPDILSRQFKDVKKMLYPPAKAGNLLGLIMGNHEETILSKIGFDLTGDLAEDLNTNFLGYSSLFHLVFKHKSGGRVRTLKTMADHGFGSGTRTEGGSVTRYCNHAGRYDVDLALYGHDHDLWVKVIAYIGTNKNGKLIDKQKVVGDCGAFVKTLSHGPYPGYAEKKGYPPRILGNLVLRLIPNDEGVKVEGIGV